ncbi:CapA family protein [Diaminobutyricimonas sp. TR449]|uniref:CapA family protein n=1 Tax=Diaminobutyricimonas sp. TR449 TaxID=2708076 RepID=UPI001423BD95|nr:CapA family protein [Diaminobutyricimonas sp. TR449]
MRRALRRDLWLIVLCLVGLAAIVFTLVADFRTRTVPDVEAISVAVQSPAEHEWSLEFTGDTMLSADAQPLLDQYGYDFPFAQVAPMLDADVVVANVETPISLATVPANPGKEYSHNANPKMAPALKRAGVDVVNLGNNHSMDMGLLGMLHTQRFTSAAGLTPFGAGQTIAEAEKPLLLRSPIGTVAVVSLGEDFGDRARATIDHAGTVAFKPETVQRGIDLARAAGADWVIAAVHWGDNYTDTLPVQRYWAQVMIDAGYDMIVGSGPHISAPIEFIDGVPVAYSLGNFIFTTPGRYGSFGKEGIGLLLTLKLSSTAPAQLTVRCVRNDNRIVDYVAQPCSEQDAQRILPTLNPRMQVGGTVGRMVCTCFEREDRE